MPSRRVSKEQKMNEKNKKVKSEPSLTINFNILVGGGVTRKLGGWMARPGCVKLITMMTITIIILLIAQEHPQEMKKKKKKITNLKIGALEDLGDRKWFPRLRPPPQCLFRCNTPPLGRGLVDKSLC